MGECPASGGAHDWRETGETCRHSQGWYNGMAWVRDFAIVECAHPGCGATDHVAMKDPVTGKPRERLDRRLPFLRWKRRAAAEDEQCPIGGFVAPWAASVREHAREA